LLGNDCPVNQPDLEACACYNNTVAGPAKAEPLAQRTHSSEETILRRNAVDMVRATLSKDARPSSAPWPNAPVELNDAGYEQSHRLKTTIE
jgi:hypothetical protein